MALPSWLLLDGSHVGGLRALGTLLDVEFDCLPFFERAVAGRLDRREVYEYVRAFLRRDEAVALVRVEPLDGSNGHEVCPPSHHLGGIEQRRRPPRRRRHGTSSTA